MNFDEQIQKLIETDERIRERHEALAESVELLHHDIEQMITHAREQDRRFDELRRSIVKGMIAFLEPEDNNGNADKS